MTKIAFVTGSSRGLGYATAQKLISMGYKVYGTHRSELTQEQSSTGINWLNVDVSNLEDLKMAVHTIFETDDHIDVLINNAGILRQPASNLEDEIDQIQETFDVNTKAPYYLIQMVLPRMNQNGFGRIVNVSSGLGQLSDMGGGYTAYRISKTALNAVTRISQAQAGQNVLINSVCPGWVRTDMGTSQASRSIEEGIETIVWLATLDDLEVKGGFYRDKKVIPW